tara:strand:- start:3 stop:623 length:621 start_codon:yes stop_codon:yes gene_type:complete
MSFNERFRFEIKTKITKGILDKDSKRYALGDPRLIVNDKKQGVVVACNTRAVAVAASEYVDAGNISIPIPVAVLPTRKKNRTVLVSGRKQIKLECQDKIDYVSIVEDVQEASYPRIDKVMDEWDDELPTITFDAKLLLSVVEAMTPIGSDPRVTIQLDGRAAIKVVGKDGGIGAVMPCESDGYEPKEVYENTRSILNSHYNELGGE